MIAATQNELFTGLGIDAGYFTAHPSRRRIMPAGSPRTPSSNQRVSDPLGPPPGSPAPVLGEVIDISGVHVRYGLGDADGLTVKPSWPVVGMAVVDVSAASDGVVYVGCDDNFLHAFDAATGEEHWREPTGGAVVGSPLIVNEIIYASTHSDVLAIDGRP